MINLIEAQQRKNRLKLADMLEHRVTDEQFNMETYTNECGTVGCALGIAVLSGEFCGLGWNQTKMQYVHGSYIFPVIDGRRAAWWEAGELFFGERAMNLVFQDTLPRSRKTSLTSFVASNTSRNHYSIHRLRGDHMTTFKYIAIVNDRQLQRALRNGKRVQYTCVPNADVQRPLGRGAVWVYTYGWHWVGKVESNVGSFRYAEAEA